MLLLLFSNFISMSTYIENSRFGEPIWLPICVVVEIYRTIRKRLPRNMEQLILPFDLIVQIDYCTYICSFRSISFLVDDSQDTEIIYYWISDDWRRKLIQSVQRDVKDQVEKLSPFDSRIRENLIVQDCINRPRLYTFHTGESLLFPPNSIRLDSISLLTQLGVLKRNSLHHRWKIGWLS